MIRPRVAGPALDALPDATPAHFPFSALAEACATERPLWDPATGPVTELENLAYIALSPLGIFAILTVAVCLWHRRTWSLVAGTVFLIVQAATTAFGPMIRLSTENAAALSEGCVILSPWPSFVLLGLALVLLWWPRKDETGHERTGP